MFENAYKLEQGPTIRNKYRKLDRLILKYVELKTLQDTLRDKRWTEEERNKIKKPANMKKIRRKIQLAVQKKPSGPQDTFEWWNVDDPKEGLPREELLLSESDEAEELEHLDDQDQEVRIERQLKELVDTFKMKNSWAKNVFTIKASGLEVLPDEGGPDVPFITHPGLVRLHVKRLTTLLHLSMMRENWKLAYTIFCLLVRLPNVDTKSLWPLGIEILIKSNTGDKDDKFFSWLANFFSGTKYVYNEKYSNNDLAAPAWRSGSKTHTPLFMIARMWTLVLKKQFSKVTDTIDELILVPPYDVEGVFYFLKIVCLVAQNIKLAGKIHKKSYDDDSEDEIYGIDSFMLDSRTTVISKINQNIVDIQDLMKTCDKLNFQYLHSSIEDHIAFATSSFDSDDKLSMFFDAEESFSDSRPQPSLVLNQSELAVSDTEYDTPEEAKTPQKLELDFDFDFD